MLTLRQAEGGVPGQGLHWPHLWAGTVLGGPPRGVGPARGLSVWTATTGRLCTQWPWAVLQEGSVWGVPWLL